MLLVIEFFLAPMPLRFDLSLVRLNEKIVTKIDCSERGCYNATGIKLKN